jgi:hypothetical protein
MCWHTRSGDNDEEDAPLAQGLNELDGALAE